MCVFTILVFGLRNVIIYNWYNLVCLGVVYGILFSFFLWFVYFGYRDWKKEKGDICSFIRGIFRGGKIFFLFLWV